MVCMNSLAFFYLLNKLFLVLTLKSPESFILSFVADEHFQNFKIISITCKEKRKKKAFH